MHITTVKIITLWFYKLVMLVCVSPTHEQVTWDIPMMLHSFGHPNYFSQLTTLSPLGITFFGDSEFPLLGWLVTPGFWKFYTFSTIAKIKTRQVNERRSFGPLKARFPHLIRFEASNLKLIVYSILYACVLLNICLKMNEEKFHCIEFDNTEFNGNDIYRQNGHQMCGVCLQNEIMQHLR